MMMSLAPGWQAAGHHFSMMTEHVGTAARAVEEWLALCGDVSDPTTRR
jgi:hypothetical protein